MSVIDLIVDSQRDYYKKHKRAVSMMFLNKSTYTQLLRELDIESISNLHGMQIVINSRTSLKLI